MLGVITADGWLIQFIVALVGACLLIWIWRMIQGRRA
jgi:uncharacterized membrane protein YeaQ/YmgE (transglycosylase-associated protein family)